MKIRKHVVLLLIFALFPALLLAKGSIKLKQIGDYRTGVYADGATEIAAFDPVTKRLFSVNASTKTVDVLSIKDPSNPVFLFSIDLSEYGKSANSVAVKNCLLAVAVENDDKQAPGRLALFWSFGKCKPVADVEIGALPDMVTFTPNGRYILVANEGEPNDDYTIDPEGSISVVKIQLWPRRLIVKTAGFTSFNDKKEALIKRGVRIFGPNATVAQDMEPEYITISANGKTAWVTLQENNALAVVDIKRGKVTDILPLGYKDRTRVLNEMDASNKDGRINIKNWPVFGMYQPDAIASYKFENETYLVTANEGDSRDYSGFSEETRVKKLVLDADAFPDAEELQKEENLGRLKITTTLGDIDNDGDYDALYHYGARSFSIWADNGDLLYDSGSEIEQIMANKLPNDFNSDDEENDSFDDRSDDKGPEPEGVAIGRIRGKTYAFLGLERIGGIMVYDITCPFAPQFIEYVNTRDFSGNPLDDTAGDMSPEGIVFVPAWQSPSKKPLLIVSYEVSGSIVIFEIKRDNIYCKNDDKPQVEALEVKSYPNPFNPVATIAYTLPKEAHVTLTVYNAIGEKITELVNDMRQKGEHQVKFDGGKFSSGVYFYVLEADGLRKVQKMYLLK